MRIPGLSRKEGVNQMVIINGEARDAAGKTVLFWLKEAGFQPERVVVERNREILAREALDQILLEDGDKVEILKFVGGG